jgi:ATP-dependent Clp protease ATP-binding subunit ClpA
MTQVETEHMLVAMLVEGEGIGAQVLKHREVTVDRLRDTIAGLRAAGKIEERRGPQAAPIRRHFLVTDQDDKPIRVDLLFPAQYPANRQDELVERIRRAIEGGTEPSNESA